MRSVCEKSRSFFAECQEIVPLYQRLKHLLPRLLTLPTIEDPDIPSRIHRSSGDIPRVGVGKLFGRTSKVPSGPRPLRPALGPCPLRLAQALSM